MGNQYSVVREEQEEAEFQRLVRDVRSAQRRQEVDGDLEVGIAPGHYAVADLNGGQGDVLGGHNPVTGVFQSYALPSSLDTATHQRHDGQQPNSSQDVSAEPTAFPCAVQFAPQSPSFVPGNGQGSRPPTYVSGARRPSMLPPAPLNAACSTADGTVVADASRNAMRRLWTPAEEEGRRTSLSSLNELILTPLTDIDPLPVSYDSLSNLSQDMDLAPHRYRFAPRIASGEIFIRGAYLGDQGGPPLAIGDEVPESAGTSRNHSASPPQRHTPDLPIIIQPPMPMSLPDIAQQSPSASHRRSRSTFEPIIIRPPMPNEPIIIQLPMPNEPIVIHPPMPMSQPDIAQQSPSASRGRSRSTFNRPIDSRDSSIARCRRDSSRSDGPTIIRTGSDRSFSPPNRERRCTSISRSVSPIFVRVPSLRRSSPAGRSRSISRPNTPARGRRCPSAVSRLRSDRSGSPPRHQIPEPTPPLHCVYRPPLPILIRPPLSPSLTSNTEMQEGPESWSDISASEYLYEVANEEVAYAEVDDDESFRLYHHLATELTMRLTQVETREAELIALVDELKEQLSDRGRSSKLNAKILNRSERSSRHDVDSTVETTTEDEKASLDYTPGNIAKPYPNRAYASGLVPHAKCVGDDWAPVWNVFPLKVFRGPDHSIVKISADWDDEMLLRQLRRTYDDLRKVWRTWFSLRNVGSMTMVLADHSFVYPQRVGPAAVSPSKNMRLRWFLHHSEQMRGRHEFMQVLTARTDVGIEFVERWQLSRIAIAILLPVILSLVVGVVYSSLANDPSTGFTIAGYMTSAFSVCLVLVGLLNLVQF